MGEDELTDVAEIHRHGRYHSSLTCLAERPERALQIAMICHAWAEIEETLIELYGLYMGMDLSLDSKAIGQRPHAGAFKSGLDANAVPLHPVATQVFTTLSALGPRLDLLEALTKWHGTPDEVEKVTDLNKRLRKRYRERSAIAHGRWAVCDECPDAIILQEPLHANRVYREHDLTQVFDRLRAVHEDLSELVRSLGKRLGQQT